MWRTHAALLLILTLMSMLLSPGCATLTRDGWQKSPVTSAPAGAAVIVNGIQRGVTPLTITLATRQKNQVIRIESPGYDPVEIRPRRKLSGETLVGSLLLGLAPGLGPAIVGMAAFHDNLHSPGAIIIPIYFKSAAVLGGLFMLFDLGGDGCHLAPMNLSVTLKKANGQPRVDIMLVDADEFRNIKWIRVRRD
ncbi:MAG: PEGA domain-containing protein [Candidatus Aminicenantes bacterium]|nr:PEGA domain-containing protein [Candidatus Aminicenantes bacterium]